MDLPDEPSKSATAPMELESPAKEPHSESASTLVLPKPRSIPRSQGPVVTRSGHIIKPPECLNL